MLQYNKKTIPFQVNLVIFIISGLLAFNKLLKSPSEKQSALLGGYSSARLFLMALILFTLIAAFLFFLKSRKPRFWEEKPGILVKCILSPWLGFALLGISYVSLSLSDAFLGQLSPYQERLTPVFIWLLITSLQLLLSFTFYKNNLKDALIHHKNTIRVSFYAWISLLVLALIIAYTKIGIKPDSVYWQDAGTPILLWQVLLATGTGIILYSLLNHKSLIKLKSKLQKKFGIDFYFFLIIWIAAFSLWFSITPRPSYNALAPLPPNFESYPFADAIIYDANAQNFLNGHPIPNDFWQKPFYSFFLAFLHIFAKQNYTTLYQFQLLFLSVIPAIIFLLTKSLANRTSAIITAILVILREANSLTLANKIQVSHSKLLMSDMFSMGFMALIVLFLVAWLKRPTKHRLLPLLLGGTLGFFTLTRGHALLLLPFIVLVALLILYKEKLILRFAEGIGILLIGLLIPMTLWLAQVYELSGSLSIQNTISPYTTQMARLYSETPLKKPERFPNENDAIYFTRIKNAPIEFIFEHPKQVINFVSAHYTHNLVFSAIYLPSSLNIESVDSYVKRMPFWNNWKGHLSTETKFLLGINLFIIALGISASYKHSRYLLLAPLFLGAGYNLSVALGRLSGWRFIMPADWITLIFYSAGLVEAIRIVHSFFTSNQDVPSTKNIVSLADQQLRPISRSAFLLIIFMFFSTGFVFTQGYKFIPAKYPEKSTQEIFDEYLNLASIQQLEIPPSTIENFLIQDHAVALYGQALYPSYLPATKGEYNFFYLAFSPKPYKRISFQLIGHTETGVILPFNLPVKYLVVRKKTTQIFLSRRGQDTLTHWLSLSKVLHPRLSMLEILPKN